MKALLTNSTRPRLGPSSVLSTTGSLASARRSNIPALRRRLKLCDAFAILLAPVLTAAFVADVTNKDRRRQAWDEKIAQIQCEIEELREKELQAWDRLQLNSIRTGTACQRRYYTTSTATPSQASWTPFSTEETEKDKQHDTYDPADVRRFEKLLARKVGLQLLLFIGTGRDPIGSSGFEGISDTIAALDNVDHVLAHLAQTHREMCQINDSLPSSAFDPNLDDPDRVRLDKFIRGLTWNLRTGQISTTELIYRYTQAVTKAPTSPSLDTYQKLVEAFSVLNETALAFIAMFPYQKTKQVLSDQNVGKIIWQYGAVRDPKRLDQFLRKLTEPERGFRIESKWEIANVNGVRVPVPSHRDSQLLDILIRVALQSDQPHRARAWATLQVQQNVPADHLAALFNNWLTYYARQLDWSSGLVWLKRALIWTAVFADQCPEMMLKVVFRILDLCVACSKVEQYEHILNAAVHSGLDVPKLDDTRPDAFSNQGLKIRDDWAFRLKESQVKLCGREELANGVRRFQVEMARVHSAIQTSIGITDLARLRNLMAEEEGWLLRDDHEDQLSTPSATSRIEKSVQPDIPPSLESTAPGLTGDEEENKRVNGGTRSGRSFELFWPFETRPENVEPSSTELQGLGGAMSQNDEGHLDSRMRRELEQRPNRVMQQNKPNGNDITQLRREHNALLAQNSEILVQLESSREKEARMNKTIERLTSELNSPKKRLETVFLERENQNLRTEMKALSERCSTIMDEKADLQKMEDAVRRELAAYKERSDKLEEKRLADLHILRQDNENLRLQVRAANARIEKLDQASETVDNSEKTKSSTTKIVRVKSKPHEPGYVRPSSIYIPFGHERPQ